MNPADFADVELDRLIKLFFSPCSQLGRFEEVSVNDVSEPSRALLAHDHHMTVTLERHHETPVDVVVLQSRSDGQHYSREILLKRKSDGAVVQYGIVRLNRSVLSSDVCQEIEKHETPLGRILINHDVLRSVKLLSLLKVSPGLELAEHLGVASDEFCFGRTALIYCDGVPAIELLEIVN